MMASLINHVKNKRHKCTDNHHMKKHYCSLAYGESDLLGTYIVLGDMQKSDNKAVLSHIVPTR